LRAHDLQLIRHWLATEPGWNRTRLSRALCQHWGWRNGAGHLKDMACRLAADATAIHADAFARAVKAARL
jgi:hypothetical protein